MAARTFTHAPDPLPPMTPCAGCKNDATREHELFILVGDKWCCLECFRKGPGKSWPRALRRENVGSPAHVPTSTNDRAARMKALRGRK